MLVCLGTGTPSQTLASPLPVTHEIRPPRGSRTLGTISSGHSPGLDIAVDFLPFLLSRLYRDTIFSVVRLIHGWKTKRGPFLR